MALRLFDSERLEEIIDTVWRGRENEACIWFRGEWLNWGTLNGLARDCEKHLKAAGFGKGQRIAVMLPNFPIVPALALACWRLGGTIAPLNARAGVANLMATLNKLDISALIVTEDGYKKIKEINADFPIIAASETQLLGDWTCRTAEPDNSDTAVIFSTSGTSGLPKAVCCTHGNIIGDVSPVDEHVPGLIVDDTVFLNVLPNFHTFGFNVSTFLPLVYGIKQAMVSSFIPVDKTLNAIESAGVTTIIAVPTIMGFLLSALEKTDHHIHCVRNVVCGADRLDVHMEERCKKYIGCGILEGYGLTECSPIVAVNPCEAKKKMGTVGPAYKTYEIQIRSNEGDVLDMHEEGVLWLKGPSVVPCYFRDEVNTSERFKDGWFNTGDVVRIDDDGYIRIVDRATDIIIVSGFNVYPKEVEDVICGHPAVHAAVAVGDKNSVAGEVVKAFVILNEGADTTQKELIDYCKVRLPHYKVPRKIGFVTEYPVSPTGKILRRELRKMKI
ncbi:MAG: AMP-binding protein [Synergistes sp.]|nr:AMP-binding protein [Synergistes sp.]